MATKKYTLFRLSICRLSIERQRKVVVERTARKSTSIKLLWSLV